MILNSPYISGSLTVTGNTNLIGALTVTGSLAGTATSSSFAFTASSAVSAYTAASAVNATTALTASYATSFTVGGTLTAQTLVVQTITSSVSFVTGSTRFGSTTSNTHQFTGSMYITGALYLSGSAGIGTNSPVSSLHLNEVSTSLTLSKTVSALSSSVGAIEWRNNYASTGAVWAKIDAVTLGTGANPWIFSNITFSTWNGFNSLTERMRITNTGNVGIGTVTPISQFHISGNTGGAFTDGLRINRNGNANQYTVINHVGGASNFMTVDTSGNNIAEMYFQRSINGTAATSSMMINTNGNVGIGTTSPAERLSLRGGSTLRFGNDGESGNNSIYLRGGATGDKAIISLNHYGYADFSINVGGSGNSILALTKTYGGTDGILVTSAGNVGIGTTSPSSLLTVAGSMAITGQGAFTSNYTVAATDTWLTAYSLSTTCVVTLPTPASNTGRMLFIRTQSAQLVNSASNNVTALATGGVGNSILSATAGKWALLFCDGTYWNIFAAN